MGDRLDGVTAVVTGGGGGIGEAACLRFAEEGADVVAFDWDGEAAEATAEDVREEHGRRALGIQGDVSDEAAVEAAADRVRDEFETVEVLVNNAGIRVDPVPVTEATEASWDDILDVNLKGVAFCSKHVIPLMADGGSVVNVASVGGHVGRENWSQYDATKGAIISMTQDMAHDHAEDGVRVNAVSPGWIITDYHVEGMDEAEAEEFVREKTTPGGADTGVLKRAGTPRELADAILFLASAESSYVTGINLPVDGGTSITGPI